MKDFFFSGEFHDFWEILYVDKGGVSVQADERKYELTAGELLFHKPNEFHAMHSIGKAAPNLVAISFYCTSPVMRSFYNKCLTLTPEERALISKIITESQNAFSTPLHVPTVEQVLPAENSPFGAQQMVQLYLEMFLITVKRNHIDTIKSADPDIKFESPANQTSKSERFDQIIRYMDEHICDQMKIEELCEASSLSRSALQALFHKEKHCGAMEYFNQLKIERAKELIRSGTMNFTEIAHFLSYSSLQYFSKQFKKATEMSPLEYSASVEGITPRIHNRNS